MVATMVVRQGLSYKANSSLKREELENGFIKWSAQALGRNRELLNDTISFHYRVFDPKTDYIPRTTVGRQPSI